ncbi:MAG: hypothetical protein ACRDRU_11805 [Pseudonocardiaceae bacterium]
MLFAISNRESIVSGHSTDPITFGDGIHNVGVMPPGKYRTSGPVSDGRECSWQRLRDTSGNPGSIIVENREISATTVVIDPSDGAFKTAGCGLWSKVS